MPINNGENVFATKCLHTYLFPLHYCMFNSNKFIINLCINGREVLGKMSMEKSMDAGGVISRLVGTLWKSKIRGYKPFDILDGHGSHVFL